MAEANGSATGRASDRTKTERKSDCELVVTRTFDAPAPAVFRAWTTPALFREWWVPKSCGATLLSCEQDVRTGGGYRLVFGHAQAPEPMAFFGRYLEVEPDARLVWTNEESADGAITTVTFEAQSGGTLLTMTERHPSKEALERAIDGLAAMPETFDQLDALLAASERR
jgi:uncharacterized protein YndB with AHSA1/START domain